MIFLHLYQLRISIEDIVKTTKSMSGLTSRIQIYKPIRIIYENRTQINKSKKIDEHFHNQIYNIGLDCYCTCKLIHNPKNGSHLPRDSGIQLQHRRAKQD